MAARLTLIMHAIFTLGRQHRSMIGHLLLVRSRRALALAAIVAAALAVLTPVSPTLAAGF